MTQIESKGLMMNTKQRARSALLLTAVAGLMLTGCDRYATEVDYKAGEKTK